jgi:hypothetical protein
MEIPMAGLARRRARSRRRLELNREQRSRNPELAGQCCDRLRPSFLRRRLEQTLPLYTAPGAALVDWRWDSMRQRVSGLVLQNNQLRPFRWWPRFNQFELRAVILQIDPLG